MGGPGGLAQRSGVVTACLLTSTISVPLYGKVSDLYGRKLLFHAAIVIFVGSMLSGLARSMTQLILFRRLQGIGGGIAVGLYLLSTMHVGTPRWESWLLKETPLRETAHIGVEVPAGEPLLPEAQGRAAEWHRHEEQDRRRARTASATEAGC